MPAVESVPPHLYDRPRSAPEMPVADPVEGIDWSVPKFEIGYWCRTRFAGQGYVTEAVRGITAFAFDALDARRVEIRCDSKNLPSARVAERAGFQLEGKLRNDERGMEGDLRDTLVFATISEGP